LLERNSQEKRQNKQVSRSDRGETNRLESLRANAFEKRMNSLKTDYNSQAQRPKKEKSLTELINSINTNKIAKKPSERIFEKMNNNTESTSANKRDVHKNSESAPVPEKTEPMKRNTNDTLKQISRATVESSQTAAGYRKGVTDSQKSESGINGLSNFSHHPYNNVHVDNAVAASKNVENEASKRSIADSPATIADNSDIQALDEESRNKEKSEGIKDANETPQTQSNVPVMQFEKQTEGAGLLDRKEKEIDIHLDSEQIRGFDEEKHMDEKYEMEEGEAEEELTIWQQCTPWRFAEFSHFFISVLLMILLISWFSRSDSYCTSMAPVPQLTGGCSEIIPDCADSASCETTKDDGVCTCKLKEAINWPFFLYCFAYGFLAAVILTLRQQAATDGWPQHGCTPNMNILYCAEFGVAICVFCLYPNHESDKNGWIPLTIMFYVWLITRAVALALGIYLYSTYEPEEEEELETKGLGSPLPEEQYETNVTGELHEAGTQTIEIIE